MSLFDIFRIGNIKQENYQLKQENEDLNNKLMQIGYPEYEKAQTLIGELNQEVEKTKAISESINIDLVHRRTELENAEKQLKSAINKTSRLKERAKSINYAIDNFLCSNYSQRISEQEIAEIENLLKNAELVDESKLDYSKVNVGSTVVLKFDGEKKEREIQIVGSFDIDSRRGRISNASPLGKAIEGKGAGDKVEYETPKGKMKCKIISVSKTEQD